MGSRLAAAAVDAAKISDRAKLVLVRMCLVAKDLDRPPVYFGGWPFLAGAIGLEYDTERGRRAVTRAVRELLDAGLIRQLGAPGPGHNVAYEIRL